jgi:hypothetical protein
MCATDSSVNQFISRLEPAPKRNPFLGAHIHAGEINAKTQRRKGARIDKAISANFVFRPLCASQFPAFQASFLLKLGRFELKAQMSAQLCIETKKSSL